jgi:Raf kinase inhibitor-like YbhB/YbcL family protein
MHLTCPYFKDGHSIPVAFTQEGDNISPPLQWSDAPEGTGSYAIIVEDPDAPVGLVTHWVIYNIPPIIQAFDREVPHGAHYGEYILQGMNTMKKMGYEGPKPPDGEHRYFFRLFALKGRPDLEAGATREQLLQAMEGMILEETQLMGRYATGNAGAEGVFPPKDSYDAAVELDDEDVSGEEPSRREA